MSSSQKTPGNGPETPPEQITVKFQDHAAQLDPQNTEQSLRQYNLGPWDDLKLRFPGITISPAFAKEWDRLDHHVQLATARTPSYSPPNFKAFCIVRVTPGTSARLIAAELRKWPAVEYAYVTGRPLLPTVNAGPNPCETWQAIHQQSPVGIDAYYAWSVPGGDGRGQVFADLEYVAMLDHEDLLGQQITIPPQADPMEDSTTGTYQYDRMHATADLGIIYAADNTIDGVGIVPNADQCYFLPSTQNIGGVNVPFATPVVIVEALNVLFSGSVMLIEYQTEYQLSSGPFLVPLETDSLWRAAIQLAVAQGVTVIEPAGNGQVNLDYALDNNGKRSLDRTSPDFVDSGAIMVGAATSFLPHVPEYNFGSRIDCYAWGDTVYTCAAYDPSTSPPAACNPYGAPAAFQAMFHSGTSAASAIIAGAAISTQGMASQTGSTLSPADLRALLSLADYGTPSGNGIEQDQIGVMPDLRKIAAYFTST
jgi:serine protease